MISGKSITDTTIATLDTVDGPKQLPAVVLSAGEAALLGEYASWCSRERLSPKLFCRDCGPESEVEVFIDPHKIGIICAHRMLYYEGPVPVVRTDHREEGEALIAPVRVVIPEVPLAIADAYMLRSYQKFLVAHGLQEAMWCLTCEDEGEPSGMRAYVRVDEIALLCRHRNLVHRGLTV